MPGSAVFFLQNAFLCHDFVLICHNKKRHIFVLYQRFALEVFVTYVINVLLRSLYFK